MTFLQPYFLWGALAVAIPVVIHFWHQKKGKPLAWAATQWLVEKNQQQQRGLKLDNVLLLLLRCLLILLLAVLLSQLVIPKLGSKADIRPLHLVQPDALILSNFRFELEEAAKRGEKLYWINETVEPIDKPDQLPEKKQFSPLSLQSAIDKIRQEDTPIHIYVLNNDKLATVPAIYVPSQHILHTLPDSVAKPRAYLSTKAGQKLFVNGAGKLTSSTVLDPAVRFNQTPAHTGPLRVLLDYRNEREQQTVGAALAALGDVYDLDLAVDRGRSQATVYDWVLTDQPVVRPTASTLYMISGTLGYPTASNIRYSERPFTPQTNDLVASGQLPEWLGEQLIQYYELQPEAGVLSQQELKNLFVVSNRSDKKPQTLVHNALLLLFVVLLLMERWIALTKNA